MIKLFLIGIFSLFSSLSPEGHKAVDGDKYRITQYCLRGRTASGSKVKIGGVAGDKRLHPLGSKVKIAGRIFLVNDTGKLIKGKHLDVWTPFCSGAKNWGVKFLPVKRI